MRRFSSNITDPELFLLFREAGENYQPDFSSEEKGIQWLKLQEELAERRAAGEQNGWAVDWRRWMALVILLIAFLFLHGPGVRVGQVGKEERRAVAGGGRTVMQVQRTVKGKEQPVSEVGRPIIEGSQPVMTGGQSEMEMERTAVSTPIVSLTSRHSMWLPVKGPGPAPRDRDHEKKARPPVKKWSIGLVAGSDWSMVVGSPGGRLGYEAGLTLQYRFAPRWSLESGLVIADKIYAARPGDYHSPIAYPGLFNVNARCRVFDMPLNIRYDFLQRDRHQAFVSTGLSSYWMQKEDYEYEFSTAGVPQKSHRTIHNQNKHILSIANISAGYEHSWKNVSFQVSPYLKLPLTGIGFGRVKLSSAGIQFSSKIGF